MIIKEILGTLPLIKFIGNNEQEINEVIQLTNENEREDVIMWCALANINLLKHIKTGTLICPPDILSYELNDNCNYIIVENPRKTFKDLLQKFFVNTISPSISNTAHIDQTVKIGQNVFIGENTVIDKNVEIGDFTFIGHNSVILADTKIGKYVKIGSNNTIGGTGFGFEKNEDGDYERMPHTGNVVIMDHVEIGNNTCIDRAVLGSTLIKENVKIDNLVHVAHGVEIGRNTLIIANSLIGGSVVVGENSWIAPSSSIINKGKIGNNSLVGLGAVVIRPVPDNCIVVGNPAKVIKSNVREKK